MGSLPYVIGPKEVKNVLILREAFVRNGIFQCLLALHKGAEVVLEILCDVL